MLFLFSLITGTFISITATSWFGAWVGLELNLLSFIPLIIIRDNQYSSEAALKYFLIQAVGSSLIIFSASLLLTQPKASMLILFCALVLKLGGAPFHFWLPQVIRGLLWPQIMIIMTIQKVAPLLLICYLMALRKTNLELYLRRIFSALVGGFGGINQTHLRKILAFSSINHIGWLLSSLLIRETLILTYFVIYCLISLSIVVLFQLKQAFHFNHILNFDISRKRKILIFFSLLSLGGLPPFIGFIPKWMVIQELAEGGNFFLLFILLASALITLYFYLRISTSSLTLRTYKLLVSVKSKQPVEWFVPYMIFFNLFGLLIPFTFLII